MLEGKHVYPNQSTFLYKLCLCFVSINDVTLAHKVICRRVKDGPSAYLSVLR